MTMNLDISNLGDRNRHGFQPWGRLLLPLMLTGSFQVISLRTCTGQYSTEVLQNHFLRAILPLLIPIQWTLDFLTLSSLSSSTRGVHQTPPVFPAFWAMAWRLSKQSAITGITAFVSHLSLSYVQCLVWCPMPWKQLAHIVYLVSLVISGRRGNLVSLLLVCQKAKVSIHMLNMIEAPWDNPLGRGGDHSKLGSRNPIYTGQ